MFSGSVDYSTEGATLQVSTKNSITSIIAPGQDIGFDLSKEYEAAKNIHDEPGLITWN